MWLLPRDPTASSSTSGTTHRFQVPKLEGARQFLQRHLVDRAVPECLVKHFCHRPFALFDGPRRRRAGIAVSFAAAIIIRRQHERLEIASERPFAAVVVFGGDGHVVPQGPCNGQGRSHRQGTLGSPSLALSTSGTVVIVVVAVVAIRPAFVRQHESPERGVDPKHGSHHAAGPFSPVVAVLAGVAACVAVTIAVADHLIAVKLKVVVVVVLSIDIVVVVVIIVHDFVFVVIVATIVRCSTALFLVLLAVVVDIVVFAAGAATTILFQDPSRQIKFQQIRVAIVAAAAVLVGWYTTHE
mmetsp:Transcript_24838/g.51441  ORF Transcript_24838/g.51441 Transcript_24838/m.51441 type:complete len:298 (+) Transcript_24838:337-1230(+)